MPDTTPADRPLKRDIERSGAQNGDSVGILRAVRHPNRLTLAEACVVELTAAIGQGLYSASPRLPSEAELAAQLAVSRATLREALSILEAHNLIVREQGRGTYVVERPIQKDLNRNFGITAMIRAAGYEARTEDCSIELGSASAEIDENLRLLPGEQVLTLDRLRLAGHRPVVFSREILSASIISAEDLAALRDDESLYGLLYKRRGIVICRGDAHLSPIVATRELARCLCVGRGAPLLRITQLDFDDAGIPVLYSVEYHVANWVRFTVERMGPGPVGDA